MNSSMRLPTLSGWPCPTSLVKQGGAALLSVLLLGAVIALAVLLFSFGTQTELKIAHNDTLGRQALAIAEAGINHAVVVVAPSAGGPTGLSAELGNTPTGALSTFGAQQAIVEEGVSFNYRCVTLSGSFGGEYCVRAYDNFDETGNESPTAAIADDPSVDRDNLIFLRSRGAVGVSTRIVEGLVGILLGPDCAIITEGNLIISGNPNVTGTGGCIHSNNELRISGNPLIQISATANSLVMEISGSPTIGGQALDTNTLKNDYETAHSGQPDMTIPNVRPMDFCPTPPCASGSGIKLWQHVMNHPQGFRLDADGNVYVGPGYTGAGGPGGAWTCTENPPNCTGGRSIGSTISATQNGWKHEDKNWGGNSNMDQWIADTSHVDGVYFVEGSVSLGKNWGTTASPWRVTLIALNSIQMSGNPIMAPYQQSTVAAGAGYVTPASPTAEWALRNILIVSGNDIELNGNVGSDSFTGGLFAHQQIKVNGNPDLRGFLIVEDGRLTWTGDPAPNCSSELNVLCDTVNGSSVSGNPNIIYNRFSTALYGDDVRRLSWNEVR